MTNTKETKSRIWKRFCCSFLVSYFLLSGFVCFFVSLLFIFFPFRKRREFVWPSPSLSFSLSLATVSDDNQTLVVVFVRPCHRHLASFFSSLLLSYSLPNLSLMMITISLFLILLLLLFVWCYSLPMRWITRDFYPWSTDAVAAVVVFLSYPTAAATRDKREKTSRRRIGAEYLRRPKSLHFYIWIISLSLFQVVEKKGKRLWICVYGWVCVCVCVSPFCLWRGGRVRDGSLPKATA